MELHLKVSELEEENLLLKQKLKETELENEKIQVDFFFNVVAFINIVQEVGKITNKDKKKEKKGRRRKVLHLNLRDLENTKITTTTTKLLKKDFTVNVTAFTNII